MTVKLQNVQNMLTLTKITEDCEKHLFNKTPKTALQGGCHAAQGKECVPEGVIVSREFVLASLIQTRAQGPYLVQPYILQTARSHRALSNFPAAQAEGPVKPSIQGASQG